MAEIRNLGLKTTRFTTVFTDLTQPAERAGLPAPPWGREVVSTAAGALVNGESNVKAPEETGPRMTSTGYCNPSAQVERLGPVLTNRRGRRVDKPLFVDSSHVEKLKRKTLCYYQFLRGECISQSCRSNHIHKPLSDEEFDALWILARYGPCRRNKNAGRDSSNGCSDVMCVYGHGFGDGEEG